MKTIEMESSAKRKAITQKRTEKSRTTQGGEENSARRKTQQHEEESLAMRIKEPSNKRRVEQHEKENRTMWRKEARKGESGVWAKLETHFILNLGFWFFRSKSNGNNNFFPCNSLTQGTKLFFSFRPIPWHPQFYFDHSNNLHV